MEDTRNLIDKYKGLANEHIFAVLSQTRTPLEIAIENVEHDFNIGSIVRTANSFNVKKVHIIGRKKYNRRGAMCTDKYLEIIHHPTIEDFLETQTDRELVAIENNTERAQPLHTKTFNQDTTLIFGSENNGITPKLLKKLMMFVLSKASVPPAPSTSAPPLPSPCMNMSAKRLLLPSNQVHN